MHTILFSLKALAFIAFLANISAATFTNTSASTNSSGDKLYTDPYNDPYTNPQALGVPNPGTTPKFDYNFNIIFKGGKCTTSQRETILGTMADIAGLSDRVRLWETDDFHNWQPEVNYWFGDDPHSQHAWIKSNVILFSVVDLLADAIAR